MLYEMPVKCPVCQGGFHIERLGCENCGSTLEGKFEIDGLTLLTGAMRQFVVSFLKCRGNIREMEKLYGISYPTVRARIDEIVSALGEQPAADGAAADEAVAGEAGPDRSDADEASANAAADENEAGEGAQPAIPSRIEILRKLADGEIDADTAKELIEKNKRRTL